MGKFKLEFILHWIWSVVFGMMLITGIALMGPKYGWAMDYNLSLADYLHRTMALVLTVLFFIEIIMEIRRILVLNDKREPWLVVGKNGFALVTFLASFLLIISGLLIWICVEDNHVITAFASIIHEAVTFAIAFGMIWHIYDKSHVLIIGGGRK